MVIAIGGNALDLDAKVEIQQLKQAAKALVPLIADGNEVVLVHGNGPQVGVIHSTMLAAEQAGFGEGASFYDCTAMNEGTIGWHLAQAVLHELACEGDNDTPVCTVVTRVVVDAADSAFSDLEKPVGSFYDEKTAKELMQRTGRKYVEDSGRGWRLAVASPKPQHIVEADTIKQLAAGGAVVIAGGGAGIPIVKNDGGIYQGIEAVCDKDTTSALIAKLIEADLLVLLTAVDHVAINYGKPDQQELSELTVDDAEKYIIQGQFAPGSMLPKVQACIDFVGSGSERTAIIAKLSKVSEALRGESGTVISSR